MAATTLPATIRHGSVGLIANPASGRDIRRLVAHASVISTDEKVRIIRRLLLALDAAGVERVLYMPDTSRLVPRAARDQPLGLELTPLPGRFHGVAADTTAAAGLIADAGAACLISLGGDGTNRAIALGSTDVPLIPLSSGTNNVFPAWRESTVAGLAAAAIATGAVDVATVARRSKLIQVELPQRDDLALIDVAVLDGDIVGSRAIWEPQRLRQLFLTRADPAAIGLSAIGGAIVSVGAEDDQGLHLMFAPSPSDAVRSVRAAIAPGLLREVHIREVRPLELAAIVPLTGPALLAFDGEREVALGDGQSARLRLTRAGPPVVDIDACLAAAREAGFFNSGPRIGGAPGPPTE